MPVGCQWIEHDMEDLDGGPMAGLDEVRDCMIDALGLTHGLEPHEVRAGLDELGDDYMLELDSKTAEFLLVAVEDIVGHRLPCPADLGQDQYSTLGTLIDVVLKEI